MSHGVESCDFFPIHLCIAVKAYQRTWTTSAQSTSSTDKKTSSDSTSNGDHLHVPVVKIPLERVDLTLRRLDIAVRRLVDILGIIHGGLFVTRLNFRHLEPDGMVIGG